MSYISCEITENNGVVTGVVTKETNVNPRELMVSLDNFRLAVNETLTKMIEDNGEIGDFINDGSNDESDESSNDESDEAPIKHKKRKQ